MGCKKEKFMERNFQNHIQNMKALSSIIHIANSDLK